MKITAKQHVIIDNIFSYLEENWQAFSNEYESREEQELDEEEFEKLFDCLKNLN